MQSTVAAVVSGLADLRRQLAKQGPGALSGAESRLEQLSIQLSLAGGAEDFNEAKSLAAEVRAIAELLAAGEAWCGELAKLFCCQTQGYGRGLEPTGMSRVRLIG
jgi:hypothetical protein